MQFSTQFQKCYSELLMVCFLLAHFVIRAIYHSEGMDWPHLANWKNQ